VGARTLQELSLTSSICVGCARTLQALAAGGKCVQACGSAGAQLLLRQQARALQKQPTYVEAGRLANVHTAMTEQEVQSEP